eukprot:scaffold1811_cov145-Skeletonema_menzelii.AAC.15
MDMNSYIDFGSKNLAISWRSKNNGQWSMVNGGNGLARTCGLLPATCILTDPYCTHQYLPPNLPCPIIVIALVFRKINISSDNTR